MLALWNQFRLRFTESDSIWRVVVLDLCVHDGLLDCVYADALDGAKPIDLPGYCLNEPADVFDFRP